MVGLALVVISGKGDGVLIFASTVFGTSWCEECCEEKAGASREDW